MTAAAAATDLATVVGGLREITVEVHAGAHGGGSGVIWSPDGLVVTSAHVILGPRGVRGDPYVVLTDRRRLPAELVECDRQLDLALLHVDAHDLPAAVLGNPDQLRPGALVMSVRCPFGLPGAVVRGV